MSRSSLASSPGPAGDSAGGKRLVVRNRQRLRSINTRLLRRLAQALVEELLPAERFDLAIYIVRAAEITSLNQAFLKHRGATDVITFNYSEAVKPRRLVGEIVVCLDEALAQARRFRTTWQNELVRYVAHGVLHLRGYDDHYRSARAKMKRAEDRLLAQLAARFTLANLARRPAR